MNSFKIGDIVTRSSYREDVAFIVKNVISKNGRTIYVLHGLMQRLEADSDGSDLKIQNSRDIQQRISRFYSRVNQLVLKDKIFHVGYYMNRAVARPGKILHIDSSKDFMDKCVEHYREARLESFSFRSDESEQPSVVRQLLEKTKADILVLTGHDGFKKDNVSQDSVERYRNSKYFIQAVREARKYESSKDKLCIFAGACQSYYEGIMGAGANFASSPGRVLINALDPAIVSKKVAITDSRMYVTPEDIAKITISGSKGIGGIKTRGHLNWA